MKPILIVLTCSLLHLYGGAQNNISGVRVNKLVAASHVANPKWSFHTFNGLGFAPGAWRGSYTNAFSASMGMQVNRHINKNLFAFAGVNASPVYTSLRETFLRTDLGKASFNHGFMRSNNFSLYQQVQLGFGYVNDARTFQISGSIGVQKNTNDYRFMLPPQPNQILRQQ